MFPQRLCPIVMLHYTQGRDNPSWGIYLFIVPYNPSTLSNTAYNTITVDGKGKGFVNFCLHSVCMTKYLQWCLHNIENGYIEGFFTSFFRCCISLFIINTNYFYQKSKIFI